MPTKNNPLTVTLTVWDTANNAPRTGETGSTLSLVLLADGAAVSGFAPTVTERGNGEYEIPITGPQNSGDQMTLTGSSSTADTVIIPLKWVNSDNLTSSDAQAACNAALVAYDSGGGVAAASAVTAVQNDTSAILADTNQLQSDWTDGGRLDLILDGVKSDTSAILVDTNELQTNWAAPSGNLYTTLSTINTTTTSIQSDTTAILADTNELQGDWVDGGRLDLILDAVKSDTSAVLSDTNELQTNWASPSGSLYTALIASRDAAQSVNADWSDGGRLDLILDGIASGVTVTAMGADVLTASALAADAVNEIADGLLDRAAAIESTYTMRQFCSVVLAAVAGVTSGFNAGAGVSGAVFRAPDGVTTRITVNTDDQGNRTSITLSP